MQRKCAFIVFKDIFLLHNIIFITPKNVCLYMHAFQVEGKIRFISSQVTTVMLKDVRFNLESFFAQASLD